MKTKNQPVRVHTQQSTQGVYEALLHFAETFNPNDPDLIQRGVTPAQLAEKRYRCFMMSTADFLTVNIESPDVVVKCSMLVKQ